MPHMIEGGMVAATKKTVVIQIFCKYGKENAPINHTLKVDNGFSFPHAPFPIQNNNFMILMTGF